MQEFVHQPHFRQPVGLEDPVDLLAWNHGKSPFRRIPQSVPKNMSLDSYKRIYEQVKRGYFKQDEVLNLQAFLNHHF